FEGQGIGTLLMTWAEERSRQAVGRTPQGVRVSMRSATPHTHQPGHRLLQDLGMERIRHFWDMKIEMAAPPPEPRWPDGITLRPFNYPQDLRPVYLAFDDAFKDHWGHVDQPVEKRLKEWRHWLDNDEEFDPALWFVVVEGDEIAGMSLCRPKTAEDPGMAWVDILGVRRPWRKRGLGLALLHHTFGEFYRRGTRKVGLGVDAGSLTGATRLYERAGMRPMRQFDLYDKELRPGHELGTQSAD
ncbi:MAG: GNAT family N-acetyltransferase, partial [Anaerolineae bacterium]